MSSIWNGAFWRATAERALSTVLQAGLAAAGVDAVGGGAGISEINWLMVANVAALAGVVSVAKNVIVGLSTDGSPSIGSAETLGDDEPFAPLATDLLAPPPGVDDKAARIARGQE